MASANLEKIIEEIRNLTLNEQRQLRDMIDRLLREAAFPPDDSLSPEEILERRLLADGVISHIPPRVADPNRQQFKPVEVKGKPLSEIIIAERR